MRRIGSRSLWIGASGVVSRPLRQPRSASARHFPVESNRCTNGRPCRRAVDANSLVSRGFGENTSSNSSPATVHFFQDRPRRERSREVLHILQPPVKALPSGGGGFIPPQASRGGRPSLSLRTRCSGSG